MVLLFGLSFGLGGRWEGGERETGDEDASNEHSIRAKLSGFQDVER